MSERIDVKSMSREELATLLTGWGQPTFRAKQLFSWLHQKGALDWAEMSNLPAALRERLAECCYITALDCRRRQRDGDTEKFLFALPDGETVETVFMTHDYGRSLCVSSQVGCNMGCRFCASAIGGKARDLTPAELLEQLYAVTRLTGNRIDSVVLMGMGEPLDNFDSVLRFLTLVRDPDGLGLSHRHISLSTCGLVDQIDRLAQENLQITLSISLHAADDETRSALMPVNRKWPLVELIPACKRYFKTTGRRVSYEYALIAGQNDSLEQAVRLARLLSSQNCHINLIPLNPVEGTGLDRPDRQSAERFCDRLLSAGLSCTIRREMGSGIDAACGQLRRNDRKGDANHVADR